MLIVTHPTGNANVRALISGLEAAGLLEGFHTTLGWSTDSAFAQSLPPVLAKYVMRRSFEVPQDKIVNHSAREFARLVLRSLSSGLPFFSVPEWASVDSVYADLDRAVAGFLMRKATERSLQQSKLAGVYCYEDGASQTFKAAKATGLRCLYELPIAYWESARQLLAEEAQRWPEWKATMTGLDDPVAKLERKTEELSLADLVICPSNFVESTLPPWARDKPRIVACYGSPEVKQLPALSNRSPDKEGKLRVLFVGAMSQRKGLADLFAAVKLLPAGAVQLTVIGTALAPMAFYRKQLGDFTYKPPQSRGSVLKTMLDSELLVLPSIVEGRALVQQEAMICGLPILITPNTGGTDLVDEGKSGFVIPIRSPESIAERITWFLENRDLIPEMSQYSRQKALKVTWRDYCQKIIEAGRVRTG